MGLCCAVRGVSSLGDSQHILLYVWRRRHRSIWLPHTSISVVEDAPQSNMDFAFSVSNCQRQSHNHRQGPRIRTSWQRKKLVTSLSACIFFSLLYPILMVRDSGSWGRLISRTRLMHFSWSEFWFKIWIDVFFFFFFFDRDDQIIFNGILFYLVMFLAKRVLPRAKTDFPLWRGDGFVMTMLLHAGPVEYLYYWLHRALHHHFLYSRYHSHHHSSIVTEPITCKTSPLNKHTFSFYF